MADKTLKELAEAIESLEARIVKLETSDFATKSNLRDLGEALADELDSHVPRATPKLKSHEDLMKAELQELEKNPDPHIERRMELGGINRDEAAALIEKRKSHIKRELGIGTKVVKAAKAVTKAAALIALAFLLLFCPRPARAQDQQGFAVQIYPLTNNTTFMLTNGASVITTTGSSNINSVAFPIRRQHGFVLHISGYTTNGSGSNVNATIQFATPHSVAWGLSNNILVTNWENSVSFNFANNLLNTTGSNFFFSTNVPPSLVDNYSLGRLTTVTNNHLSTLFLDPTNTFIDNQN